MYPVSDRLSHTDVFGVIRLNENKYLAVTWNGYTVMTIDKNNQDEILTEVYSNTSSLMYRNLETRMIAAYYDSHGILWIGTDGGGVIWSDLRMQFYNCFYQDRHNEICSIVADDDHYLWLATYHKGIMRKPDSVWYFGKNRLLSSRRSRCEKTTDSVVQSER